jgi:hypothetical protein
VNVYTSIVSLYGRERMARETVRRFMERGGLSNNDTVNLFHFGKDGGGPELGSMPHNVIVTHAVHESILGDFRAVLYSVPEGKDWLFLEDDLSPCRQAYTFMAAYEIPSYVGLVSFFDYRNQWPSPGLHCDPVQPFWGSQALKIPGRIVDSLKRLAVARFADDMKGWDTWLGRAMDELRLNVAHYAPSVVQHIGARSVVYSDVAIRPTANNFPGEDFDAWTMPADPIVPGPWTPFDWHPSESPDYCNGHRKIHPNGNYCPQIRK